MKRAGSIFISLTVMLLLGCARNATPDQQQITEATGRNIEADMRAQQQMLRYREQAQAQMIGSLTAAHKQLLGRLVGELATDPKPHMLAAVASLDAALSPTEKRAILGASRSLRREAHLPLASMDTDPGMALLLTVTTVTSWRTSMAARARTSPHKVQI
jgi:hypothetical protein